MEKLEPTGLINDEKIKNFYIDKFKVSLTSDKKVQVYISKKHGYGAGKYIINNININGQKVLIFLDFKASMFEAGAAVINQRVLFFKVEPNCKIIEVISSNLGKK